jgi:hypothetical protein
MDAIAIDGFTESPLNPRELDLEIDPPIEFLKKRFTTLHLEEPTALQMQRAEFEIAEASNMFTLRRYQIKLVAEVAGVPREVVERMRISQVGEAFRFLEPYTPLFRLTGTTLSPTSRAGGDGDRMTPGDSPEPN